MARTCMWDWIGSGLSDELYVDPDMVTVCGATLVRRGENSFRLSL